ncbi:mRNA-decapping enzyme subunit 2 isoform X2 [Arachis duranensis]|uniref:mRNA-decapping enzyme subunit 2 isoform X2 n=1 Tax=Arachis duranensis TaxID=130453 RepID=A0A9C6WLN8_ARADU|nr:mRNA-decapping enzyme subunit 2 isoform X2 [Arachis duranensis]
MWHRLDDLQPASDEVICRGITGPKLYMVSPFLASLKSWTHPPPLAPRPDLPLKVKEFACGKQSTVLQGVAHHSWIASPQSLKMNFKILI